MRRTRSSLTLQALMKKALRRTSMRQPRNWPRKRRRVFEGCVSFRSTPCDYAMWTDISQAGRTQLEKITAAAHARQKATFNPQAAETPRSTPPKTKRRVSMGVVINEETGEVIESARKRQSRRTHTMMNTSATFNRMKEEEVKKVGYRSYAPHCNLILLKCATTSLPSRRKRRSRPEHPHRRSS